MAELKAKFTKMTDGTPEDWSIIAESNINEAADLPGKILNHLIIYLRNTNAYRPSSG